MGKGKNNGGRKRKEAVGEISFFWGGVREAAQEKESGGEGNYMKQKTEKPAELQKPEEIQTKIETLMEKQQRRIRGRG